jgi:hypothetical protein
MWTSVETALSDLVANGDLVEQTNRKYIVGYFCKVLAAAPEKSLSDFYKVDRQTQGLALVCLVRRSRRAWPSMRMNTVLADLLTRLTA